jgi:hypothetical protein
MELMNLVPQEESLFVFGVGGHGCQLLQASSSGLAGPLGGQESSFDDKRDRRFGSRKDDGTGCGALFVGQGWIEILTALEKAEPEAPPGSSTINWA